MTTPDQIAADFAALTNLFIEFGVNQSDQTILRLVSHHTLPQLIALGWLRLEDGRWNNGRYTPSGALLAAVNGEDQFAA